LICKRDAREKIFHRYLHLVAVAGNNVDRFFRQLFIRALVETWTQRARRSAKRSKKNFSLLARVWSAGFVHHVDYRPTRALVVTPEEISLKNFDDKC
jgi:hypothetical protein